MICSLENLMLSGIFFPFNAPELSELSECELYVWNTNACYMIFTSF